jgi:succinylglutamic semialdehyde dehydrogenase
MPLGKHFIEDTWIEGTGPNLVSTDPASEEINWQGRAAAKVEVDRAVDAASKAFEAWADTSLNERIRFLKGFEELLIAHERDLAEVISRETGKPMWESLTEVAAMIGKIAISIDAHNDRCGTVFGKLGDSLTATRFKPHGVAVVFGPFNFPGHLPNGHIVPALLAGNTVVFKPSELAPLVAERSVRLWDQAGLPAGVINMVQGGRDTGIALASHPRLDGLFFTGAADTGKAIHRAYGGHPEKILALEMGGNNPLVVHDVSNIEAAAFLTVQSAFITSGQRCTCARRLIVPVGNEGDDFLDRLVSMIGSIRVGTYTDDPEPFMGPVISADAADKLLDAQETLHRSGGRILVEMNRQAASRAMLSPGLIDVTDVADRGDRELFGPILQLIRVPDFDAAISEANNTSFGLAAGLLSDNRKLYERFFRRVRAGIINWNRQITGASGRMPFGGVGFSGNHRPAAYFSADYCSYPVASIEQERLTGPPESTPGIDL